MHSKEPWLLASLYSGKVIILNLNNQEVLKTFNVSTKPVRSSKWIERKKWIICGSDEGAIRVYNYNTQEKLKQFEAHPDFIRGLSVNPTLPYVLSCSDDLTIKLWDWEKGWKLAGVFEGHNSFVMQVAWNPKDQSQFASASLDGEVKIWSIGSKEARITLNGHTQGVNCVEWYKGKEKPFLISGSDDFSVRLWDYQNKSTVHTLTGHESNVNVVFFHPTLPLIVSGSEDGTVKIWHAINFKLEKSLDYGMGRCWSCSSTKGSTKIAIGFDKGIVYLKLGNEVPSISMDQNGKVIWAKHNEVQTTNLKQIPKEELVDGEKLSLNIRDLGQTEIFPKKLTHSPNGRFVSVIGDGDYTIYTALAWRNKNFGSATQFVWSSEGNTYAIFDARNDTVKIFENWKEHTTFEPPFRIKGIFGGALLGIKSDSFICFYDWDKCKIIRRIDVNAKNVMWSDNEKYVTIATDENVFYVLSYDQELIHAVLEVGNLGKIEGVDEDGIESAFEPLYEFNIPTRGGKWVGDCFIFINNRTNSLCYSVGERIETVAHLPRPMYILGYLPKKNRIFLADKALSISSYLIPLNVIEYQTAILRKDYEIAEKILPLIPHDRLASISRFLESLGLIEMSLQITTDPTHKFELALKLGKVQLAEKVADETDNDLMWKRLSDMATNNGDWRLAIKSMWKIYDLNGLLLVLTCLSDRDGLEKLAKVAQEREEMSIAFNCYYCLGEMAECLKLLCFEKRFAEATLLARTYVPSKVEETLQLWQNDLKKDTKNEVKKKISESLASPKEYPNLFPNFETSLQIENLLKKNNKNKSKVKKSTYYPKIQNSLSRNLIEEYKENPEQFVIEEEEEEEEEKILLMDFNNSEKENINEKEKEKEMKKVNESEKENEKENENEKEKEKTLTIQQLDLAELEKQSEKTIKNEQEEEEEEKKDQEEDMIDFSNDPKVNENKNSQKND
ncbi:coatomer subunit beta'-1 [Anaeramoeba flamelloides]|uniref:Coatomer subunit beta' n=1 Tax=Anaeramoeba flamelloides TaxID=1746091 RepID=A0AAV7ZDV0_9EUKA|nr:coatomer subunit beta'-1 [Anaeramoeba flamelloides]